MPKITVNKPNKFKSNRRCSICGAILSTYNPKDTCFHHYVGFVSLDEIKPWQLNGHTTMHNSQDV